MNTQNTLFLGSSNDFGGSSILNKNITHITGIGQSKNETLYDYSNGKKFFDSSVVNNINAGMTMTSLAQGGENLLTNMSNDNTCGLLREESHLRKRPLTELPLHRGVSG